jgi:pimeloyl-ACP methyl ester carboxylesterase
VEVATCVRRAPNGTVQDLREYSKDKPPYDPALIKVPVLVINAEWDVDTPPEMNNAVFSKLVNAPYRRRILLSEGTHDHHGTESNAPIP